MGILLSLAFLAGLAIAAFTDTIPVPAAAIYFIASFLILPLYGWDKFRARRAKSRIPESTLHFLEIVGGWPGAFLAQRLFRHKTQKWSYQRLFRLIVALHLAVWTWFLFIR